MQPPRRAHLTVCGRFVASSGPDALAARFRVDEVAVDDWAPDYNVAPRAEILAIRDRRHPEPGPGAGSAPAGTGTGCPRVLSRLRWGLVPAWAPPGATGDRMINARSETLLDRAAYRRALRDRRCIIPVDGFYEWRAAAGGRSASQPYYVRARDRRVLALAGLWAIRPRPPVDDRAGDRWLRTCTIVTTRADELLASVHHRMPLVLAEESWDRWLAPEPADAADLADLLEPRPADLVLHPVGRAVSRADATGAELIRPLPSPEDHHEAPPPGQLELGPLELGRPEPTVPEQEAP